jgi:hypothetical protein
MTANKAIPHSGLMGLKIICTSMELNLEARMMSEILSLVQCEDHLSARHHPRSLYLRTRYTVGYVSSTASYARSPSLNAILLHRLKKSVSYQ